MIVVPDALLAALVGLAVLAVFAVALMMTRRRTGRHLPDERLVSFENRLGTVERRLGRTEELAKSTEHDVRNVRMSMGALATKDSVNDVKVQLGELRGDVRANTQATNSMHHSLERVESFLMEAAAKRIAGVPDGGNTE